MDGYLDFGGGQLRLGFGESPVILLPGRDGAAVDVEIEAEAVQLDDDVRRILDLAAGIARVARVRRAGVARGRRAAVVNNRPPLALGVAGAPTAAENNNGAAPLE
jgi:hypothetical protein